LSDAMKKVTILALHLGYGGIETAISDLANMLIENYEVEIVSTYKIYPEPVNAIDEKVKIKYLTNLKPNKKELLKAIRSFNIKNILKEGIKSFKILKLKKYAMINYIQNSKSDVIISTRDIHNKWLGKYGNKNTLKIGWEHNHHHGDKRYIKKIIRSVENLDYFILVSHDLENFYKDKVRPKCVYIPNIVTLGDTVSNLDKFNIVSIGRLSKEKAFLDLIDIFYEINKKYPNWKLNIIGDGTEYSKIKSKISEYNLNKSVIMHGFLNKKEIEKILVNSSIYVMTSFTESFGIVLLEAMSYKVPCVAYSSAEGAREIITDNVSGYLIPNRDTSLMIEKISLLIENYDIRCKLGANALKNAGNYTSDKVKDKWINIIK